MPDLSSSPTSAPASDPAKRVRLRKQMLILATVLAFAGFVVLAFLTRIPLPLRLAVGLTDLIASAVLFLVVRQKFA